MKFYKNKLKTIKNKFNNKILLFNNFLMILKFYLEDKMVKNIKKLFNKNNMKL